jgi:hypothetical protein
MGDLKQSTQSATCTQCIVFANDAFPRTFSGNANFKRQGKLRIPRILLFTKQELLLLS